MLADGLGFTEGPVIADDGSVLVVDIDSGRVLRVADGATTVVATPGGGPNGMAAETATTVLVANNGGFLWTEVNGVRIPIDHPTHTNEPPGFAAGGSSASTSPPARSRCCTASATGGCSAGRTTSSSTRSAACGSPTTARAGGRASTAAASTTSRRTRGPGDDVVREVAFPLLGPNGVGLSPDGRPGLRRRDAHRSPVGVGPRRSRRGPSGGRLAGGPSRRRVRGGHAVLVRLAGGRGRRPDRDRRDRRRRRRGHARRQRDRRAPDPRRRHDQSRLRRRRRPPRGDHALALRPPRRAEWPRPGLVAATPEGGHDDDRPRTSCAGTPRDDTTALFFEDRSWTYRELVDEACRRAALLDELRDPRPAAAHRRAARQRARVPVLAGGRRAVGRRRGRHQLDVPGRPARPARPPHRLPADRHRTRASAACSTASTPAWPTTGCSTSTAPSTAALIAAQPTDLPATEVTADDLLLLIFTSGSTGLPKAVRCTQGRYARTGAHVATIAELGRRRRDVHAAAVLPLQLAVHRLVVGDQRRHPGRHAGAVLGVGHAGRHPPLGRDDARPTPARS